MATSHQIRKQTGLCTACGGKKDNHTQKCSSCRSHDNQKNKQSMHSLRLYRFSSRQCIDCGQPSFEYRCDHCKEKDSRTHRSTPNRSQARQRQKIREATDIQFKLRRRLRSRLKIALLKEYKSGSAVSDLGCSITQLKEHLQSQFTNGMSWENYGQWHIDHISPLAKFDLTNREQFLQACNYTNLQPLWAEDNLRKGVNEQVA